MQQLCHGRKDTPRPSTCLSSGDRSCCPTVLLLQKVFIWCNAVGCDIPARAFGQPYGCALLPPHCFQVQDYLDKFIAATEELFHGHKAAAGCPGEQLLVY